MKKRSLKVNSSDASTALPEDDERDKQEEQVQLAAYKLFDGTTADKKKTISEAEVGIDLIDAGIQKYTADAARLSEESVGHDENVPGCTSDQSAASTLVRTASQSSRKLHFIDNAKETEPAQKRCACCGGPNDDGDVCALCYDVLCNLPTIMKPLPPRKFALYRI